MNVFLHDVEVCVQTSNTSKVNVRMDAIHCHRDQTVVLAGASQS